MPSYTFSIDSMHVNFQRSSIHDSDSDWLVLTVTSGGVTRQWADQVGSGIVSNTALTPKGDNPWLVDFGDINLSDADPVLISMVMTNLSHTDTQQQEAEALKIAGAVGAVLKDAKLEFSLASIPVVGGIPVASAVAEFVLSSVTGVLAVGSAVLALLGEILGAADKPNCNGLVFNSERIFSGKQLNDLTSNFTAVSTQKETLADQQSGHDCGSNPVTEVVFSIVPNPAGFDLKRFLIARGFDPKKGIRQMRPNILDFSVKSLLNI